jgi:hypothetical protein
MAIDFKLPEITKSFRARRFDELGRLFLEVLGQVQRRGDLPREAGTRRELDLFVKYFVFSFTEEDFAPSDEQMAQFIALNTVIADVVAASSFRSTDAFIEILKLQTRNFAKLLTLYSARNTVTLDRRVLFDTEADLASQWYFGFWENHKTCCAGERTLQNLREHLQFFDRRMKAVNGYVHHTYFGSTYVDCDGDQTIKRYINACFRNWGPAHFPIENRPDRRRVAVITAKWVPNHPVYRCTHSFVEALAAEFDLTLLHLGPDRSDLDTSLFKEVRRFQLGSPTNFSPLTPNDWGVAYYPDIGMNIESIFLSNLRLAPIQICGYGHPVSTYGSLIDYWLGGREIESVADYERNYSERLVLVPGTGVARYRPEYRRQGLSTKGEVVLVNCPWTAQKINYPLLARLRRILERSKRRIQFRFYAGVALSGTAFAPMMRELCDLLGRDNVDLFGALPYRKYMESMEEGAFCLDSFPFGGYATAIDALCLGKPMVTQEGTKFYNRCAASLLRRVELHELIAPSCEAYEDLALRLVHDDPYRDELRARLAAVDLERSVFSRDDARSVVKAFRYLVENHDRLRADGDRRPILIDD